MSPSRTTIRCWATGSTAVLFGGLSGACLGEISPSEPLRRDDAGPQQLHDAGPDASMSQARIESCALACEHGGSCVLNGGEPSCSCPVQFVGDRCQTPRPQGLNARPANMRCVSPAGTDSPTMPTLLSKTGCFDANGEPAEGLIPYWVRVPLWSDGADKRRFIAAPDGATIAVDAGGDFLLPVGTILIKEFSLAGVRVETRLFMQYAEGYWAGYSYAWLDQSGMPLKDARLLPDADVAEKLAVSATDRTWTYPTRKMCIGCHTEAANRALGLEVGQLNFDATYPGGATANQLYTLWSLGLVEGDIERFGSRVFPAADDDSAPLADRVWAYLSANCSSCHFRTGGRGSLERSHMPDVRYDLLAAPQEPHPLASKLCGVPSGVADIGLGTGALLVSPGKPGEWSDLSAGGSVIYLRMAARSDVPGSTGTMPPIGTAVADHERGLSLVGAWIKQLTCP